MTVSTGAGNMEGDQGVGAELSVQWWQDPFSHSPISKETFCVRSSVQSLSRVRLFETLWTARRSNQSILKEISPKYSLEGLMLKPKLQYFGHLMRRADSLEKTLMLGKIEGGGKGDDRE